MTKKTGVCGNCKKSKVLYEIKKSDYTKGEIIQSKHWWCSNCYDTHLNMFTRPIHRIKNDKAS